MQLSPKIKNKSLLWSALLKVRVGTVVNAGGNYYYNTSGINTAVTDTNNWFKIYSGISVLDLNKTATDIDGEDPNFQINIATENPPDFPIVIKVYIDINGDDNYQLVEPVIYDPMNKIISGLSSPVDFPNQKIKILLQ